jgi:hypothetical protein
VLKDSLELCYLPTGHGENVPSLREYVGKMKAMTKMKQTMCIFTVVGMFMLGRVFKSAALIVG